MMSSASAQIVFHDVSASLDYQLSLELDDERNGGKSIFKSSDTCYIRCYPAMPGITYRATQGSVHSIGEYPQRIDETITFANSDRGSLSGLPMTRSSGVIPTSPVANGSSVLPPVYGRIFGTLLKLNPPRINPQARVEGIEWHWLGYDPGVEPLFAGTDIILPHKVIAVLWVRYTTFYTLLEHTNSAPVAPPCDTGDPCDCPAAVALVSAQLGETVATLTVNWDVSRCTEMTDITVTDMCSGNPIKGAMVYVDGKYAGMTNEQGILRLPLSPGKHTIRATAMGYRPTDQDEVRNEEVNI